VTTDAKFAASFKTLAHPRRARLFRLLVTDPEAGRSFTALMSASGYRKAPLSHHLDIMERGGLIRRHRIGNAMTFMLTPGPLSAAMADAQRLASHATGPTRRAA